MEIELPKLQERLFPKMLKTLEEEKQAGYVRDFQLTYGNIEETFQKMGESIHASKSEITTPLGSDTWKCSQDRLCLYRSFFLIWKRALLTILHVPLLLSQIVVPLFLVLSTTEEQIKSTPAIREKVSYASAPPGRFIVFNSNGDPLLANTMTRFISNYKHIEVIFSDEKKWDLAEHDGYKHYWRDLRKEKRVLSRRNFGDRSVMVWAAFSGYRLVALVVVSCNIDSEDYQYVLKEHPLPYLRRFRRHNLIFQQDNAPIHV